jgi:GNAT superfamily N-acetyltransferase
LCTLTTTDAAALAEIRAAAMRDSLARLGRYDDRRVRQRFLDAFDPAHTWGIVIDDELVGCVALRPEGDDYWLEHVLLLPSQQGRGTGTEILTAVLDHARGHTVRLNVLQHSEARALYERFGFELESQDPVDVFMVRRPRPL